MKENHSLCPGTLSQGKLFFQPHSGVMPCYQPGISGVRDLPPVPQWSRPSWCSRLHQTQAHAARNFNLGCTSVLCLDVFWSCVCVWVWVFPLNSTHRKEISRTWEAVKHLNQFCYICYNVAVLLVCGWRMVD